MKSGRRPSVRHAVACFVLPVLVGCTVRPVRTTDAPMNADVRAIPDAPGVDVLRLDVPGLDGGRPDAPVVDAARTDAPDARTAPDAAPDVPVAPTDAPRPRRDADDAAPPGCGLPLIAECSDPPSIYEAPCSARELHVIGHYQPAAPMVSVTVSRTGVPVVLSLSSYEPTTWSVVALPGVTIERIVVDGYSRHTVLGPPGVEVVNRSGPGSGIACAYRWPYDTGGCDTEELAASLLTLTGLRPTSFMGCYEGAGYRVGG